MGANIGTTITSTLVTLFLIKDRQQFEYAVAASSCHALFNWFTMLVLLPIEVCFFKKLSKSTKFQIQHNYFQWMTKMLEKLSEAIVKGRSGSQFHMYKLMKYTTKPLLDSIVKVR